MRLSLEAVRRLAQHLGRLLLLRADLAAEELALARRQWLLWLVTALMAFACLLAALVGAGAWLTLLWWDRFGAATPGLLALLLAVASALLVRSVARQAAAAPAALSRTRAAVRDDYEVLAAAIAPARDAGAGE